MSGAGNDECAVCHKKEIETPVLNCAKCRARNYCGAACQKSDWPTHKQSCRASNYILKVTLHPDELRNPSITRTLSCPASASFLALHEALQISFGWAFAHLFEFKVRPPGSGFTHPFDLSRQPVEMLVIGDDECEQRDLSTFLPTIGHSAPVKAPVKASNIRIENVLGNQKYKDAVIMYKYDFGDSWGHEIVVVGHAAATDNFICIAGEGHGAAEDVSGFTGWEELKEAYRAAVPTKDQEMLKNWYENDASNGDTKGLGGGREWVWDQNSVNLALGRVRL